MKYATWTIKQPEGITPEPAIREAEGWAEGGMMLNKNTVLGYMSDDVDVSVLSEWNVTVKTQAQALALAQAINPECFLTDDDTIKAPFPNNN